MTLVHQLQALHVFLNVFLPEPSLMLEADLAQACADDPHLDLWSTFLESLQDYGYVWPMPWCTAPQDVAYGLSALWKSYSLPTMPSVPLFNLAADSKTDVEHLVREFGILAESAL